MTDEQKGSPEEVAKSAFSANGKNVIPSWFALRSRIRFIGSEVGEQLFTRLRGSSDAPTEVAKRNEFVDAMGGTAEFFLTSNLLLLIMVPFASITNPLGSYYSLTVHGQFLGLIGLVGTGVPSLLSNEDLLVEPILSKTESAAYRISGLFFGVYATFFLLLGAISPAATYDLLAGATIVLLTVLLSDIAVRDVDIENPAQLIAPLNVKQCSTTAMQNVATKQGIYQSIIIGTLIFWIAIELSMLVYQVRIDQVLSRIGLEMSVVRPEFYYQIPVSLRLCIIFTFVLLITYRLVSLIPLYTTFGSIPTTQSRSTLVWATLVKILLRLTCFLAFFVSLLMFAIVYDYFQLDSLYALAAVLLSISLALYLFSNFSFAHYIILRDQYGAVHALRTSWRIARGNRFSIFSLEISGSVGGQVLMLGLLLGFTVLLLIIETVLSSISISPFITDALISACMGFLIVFRSFVYISGFDQLSAEESSIFCKKVYPASADYLTE